MVDIWQLSTKTVPFDNLSYFNLSYLDKGFICYVFHWFELIWKGCIDDLPILLLRQTTGQIICSLRLMWAFRLE